MTAVTEKLSDRSETETGVLCIDWTPEACDVIYAAVMAELEEFFGGPNGHLGQELIECERREIARGVVARVTVSET